VSPSVCSSSLPTANKKKTERKKKKKKEPNYEGAQIIRKTLSK